MQLGSALREKERRRNVSRHRMGGCWGEGEEENSMKMRMDGCGREKKSVQQRCMNMRRHRMGGCGRERDEKSMRMRMDGCGREKCAAEEEEDVHEHQQRRMDGCGGEEHENENENGWMGEG